MQAMELLEHSQNLEAVDDSQRMDMLWSVVKHMKHICTPEYLPYLDDVCEVFRRFQFFNGAVELCVAFANGVTAEGAIRDAAVISRTERERQTAENRLRAIRHQEEVFRTTAKILHDCFCQVRIVQGEVEKKPKEERALRLQLRSLIALKAETLSLVSSSPACDFHEYFCEWLRINQHRAELLDLNSPFLEQYLLKFTEALLEDDADQALNLDDDIYLLAEYYATKQKFEAAASCVMQIAAVPRCAAALSFHMRLTVL